MSMDETANLLKRLTEADGAPGFESEVRAVVKSELAPLGDLSRDHLGSVICTVRGQTDTPRVMLAGHMDEVGFMVRHIHESGHIYFMQLGGWWDQVLLGQRVRIKTRSSGNVIGVIGAKPPHLLTPEERGKMVVKDNMFIDIGATSREEAEKTGVRVGDAIVPHSGFELLSIEGRYLSKAFDDRVGVALVIDALKQLQDKRHPNTVAGAATTQEEPGLRGARTSAEASQPDVAIILESDIAGDVPGIDPQISSVKLGGGPSVQVFDNSLIPNVALRYLVMDTAQELGIPLQLSSITGGGNDGGQIQFWKRGVPTVCLAVPARHIHSHGSIIDRGDYDKALKLLVALIRKLDAQTVASLTD
ncbi:MAG TPA: M42 family metallopeptidase [Phototrophicaceae bacterium]|nr:M42 family metallopeptidase [Phototrophicaceae bacterium]